MKTSITMIIQNKNVLSFIHEIIDGAYTGITIEASPLDQLA